MGDEMRMEKKTKKVLINGVQVTLEEEDQSIATSFNLRYYVKTSSGVKSGIGVKTAGKVLLSYDGRVYTIEEENLARNNNKGKKGGVFVSPLPAQVVEVFIENDQKVHEGDKLLVIEAMKTQQTMRAPFDGTVAKLSVKSGDLVQEGSVIVEILPDSTDNL